MFGKKKSLKTADMLTDVEREDLIRIESAVYNALAPQAATLLMLSRASAVEEPEGIAALLDEISSTLDERVKAYIAEIREVACEQGEDVYAGLLSVAKDSAHILSVAKDYFRGYDSSVFRALIGNMEKVVEGTYQSIAKINDKEVLLVVHGAVALQITTLQALYRSAGVAQPQKLQALRQELEPSLDNRTRSALSTIDSSIPQENLGKELRRLKLDSASISRSVEMYTPRAGWLSFPWDQYRSESVKEDIRSRAEALAGAVDAVYATFPDHIVR